MSKKQSVMIDYNRIEKEVWQIAEPLVASLGAELIDVEYKKEGGSWYLRLFLDRVDKPVDHDLCEQVSNLVSAALDRKDPIQQPYYLEVSSPGLERPLKRTGDFARFAGSEIVVKLYVPQDGQKEFSGILRGLEEGSIVLDTDGATLRFFLEMVAKAHLKVDL